MDIHELIRRINDEVKAGSRWIKIYPGTETTEQKILQWESKSGLMLPPDYRLFLSTIGGLKLHGARPKLEHSFSVKFFSLSELLPFWKIALGRPTVHVDDSWIAIADIQDGNYIAMDVKKIVGNKVRIIDGWAGSASSGLPVISLSFTEFLERSIEDSETSSGWGDVEKGIRYWSRPGGYYGDTFNWDKSKECNI